MKNCGNRNFLKHIMVPLRRFSLVWDKKLSTENRDTSSLPLIYQTFETRFNVKHTSFLHITKIWSAEGFPFESFRYCETTNIRRKVMMPVSLYFPLTSSIPETCWYTEGFLYEIFEHCETTTFRRKIVILPTLSAIEHFETKDFLQHKNPLRNFPVRWDNIFSPDNRDTPSRPSHG